MNHQPSNPAGVLGTATSKTLLPLSASFSGHNGRRHKVPHATRHSLPHPSPSPFAPPSRPPLRSLPLPTPLPIRHQSPPSAVFHHRLRPPPHPRRRCCVHQGRLSRRPLCVFAEFFPDLAPVAGVVQTGGISQRRRLHRPGSFWWWCICGIWGFAGWICAGCNSVPWVWSQ